MQSVQDCFSKVKSICYKYISSQETKNQKFKNKRSNDKIFFNSGMFLDFKKKLKKKNL